MGSVMNVCKCVYGFECFQGGGLFGAAKPTGFGAATTSSIGFGGGSSLFGKTSTASTFGFGTNTSTAGGFGGK